MTPEAILWLLSQWAIRATLLAAVAATLLRILRVRGASARLAVWTAVLAGALLIPAVNFIAPALPVPMPGSRPARASAQQLPAPSSTESMSAPDSANQAAPLTSSTATATLRWPILVVTLWALVAAAMLAKFMIALLLSYRLSRTAMPIGQGIAESSAVTVPVTLGPVRPLILLPSEWVTWEPWKLQAIIAHEQSHAKRRDPLRQALGSVYRALCWFHPLAWWLHRHLVELAEAASDDAALQVTPDCLLYAEALIGFFEKTPRRVRWEGVAMAKKGKATRRIERILDSGRSLSGSLTRGAIVTLVISALPLIYLASSARPAWAAARDNRSSGVPAKELWEPIWTVASLQKPAVSEPESDKKDFTGVWRIDPGQISEEITEIPNAPADAFPPPPPPPPLPPPGRYEIERITRSGDLLRIAGSRSGALTLSTIKLDGSEVQNRLANGIVKTAMSRLEGGKIITDWKLEQHGNLLLEGHEVRSLSADGNRQTVDRTVKSTRQERKTHLVMLRES